MTQAIERNRIACKQFNSPLRVIFVSRTRLALLTKDKLVKNLEKHASSETSMSIKNEYSNKKFQFKFNRKIFTIKCVLNN